MVEGLAVAARERPPVAPVRPRGGGGAEREAVPLQPLTLNGDVLDILNFSRVVPFLGVIMV